MSPKEFECRLQGLINRLKALQEERPKNLDEVLQSIKTDLNQLQLDAYVGGVY